MGIVSNDGSLANAAYSLDLSYPILENLLETPFTEQHVTDYFDTAVGELCFRLTNMFIDADSLVVRVSTDGLPLTLPTSGEALDPSAYTLQADKGILTLRTQPRVGLGMLSVAYDSGLPTSDDDESVLAAPEWLESCSVALAVQAQNIVVSATGNRKDKSVTSISASLRMLASQMVNSRKRPRMTVTFPTVSVVDE
jgi:hypothetical protein